MCASVEAGDRAANEAPLTALEFYSGARAQGKLTGRATVTDRLRAEGRASGRTEARSVLGTSVMSLRVCAPARGRTRTYSVDFLSPVQAWAACTTQHY